MLGALASGDPQVVAKLGALVDPGGWVGFLTSAAQVTAVAGLLGFGVVLSWLFGREFADGTITGLFGLPVGRGTIAAAKLVVYALWSVVTAVALAGMLLLLGLAAGLGTIPPDVVGLLTRQVAVTVLTAALALPAAWAATMGRGLLAGIGTILGVVVVAQVAVFSGWGAWFPFSAPGLWATGGPVSAVQLALVAPVALLFAALVVVSWRRLQLDR
jgi:ABC-2 type transport system permease protein